MENIKNILIMILLSILVPVLVIAMVYVTVSVITMASSLFVYWLILSVICSISIILAHTVKKDRLFKKYLLICYGLVLIISGIILLIG